ncbi:MAG: hypothetical protein PHC52_00485 [Syntrophales bacterium]|nr:hypothetical protein [Syntrophales bacterium]
MAKKKAKKAAKGTRKAARKTKARPRAGAGKRSKGRKAAKPRAVAQPKPRAFNHHPKAAKAGRGKKPKKVAQSWPVGRRTGDRAFPMHIHYSAKPGFKDSSQLTIGYGPDLAEAIRRVEEVLDRYQRDKEASKFWFQISLSWFDKGEWHSELA